MYNIDVIMDMMSWDSDKEEQKKGIELAKNIKCLDAFVQPNNNVHGKDVWENCALVLSAKSDNDLKPLVFDLLEWLEDINQWKDNLLKLRKNIDIKNFFLEE